MMSMHDELALLGLRGTFLLPELQEQGLLRRIGNEKVWHALPIDQEHLIIHTQTSVSLHALSAQSILWEIDCPSPLFALNSSRNLLVLSSGATILLWDLRTGQLLHRLAYRAEPDQFQIDCLELSSDGSMLAAGMASDDESVVGLWDTRNGHLIYALPLEDPLDAITTLAFHPEGSVLAGGSFENHLVWLWSLDNGRLLKIWDLDLLSSANDRAYNLAFHPDGTWLFAAYGKGGIRVWDVRQQQEVSGPTGDWYPISVAIDPGGRYLALAHFDDRLHVADQHKVAILEIRNWRLIHEFAECPPFTYPFFSLDGQWLAMAQQNKELIHVREVTTGQLVGEVNFSPLGVFSLHPSKQWFVSQSFPQSGEASYHVWRVADGSLLHNFAPKERFLEKAALSPDGNLFAAIRNYYNPDRFTLQLWHGTDGKFLATLEGHTLAVRCLAFSPDSQLLASGSTDQTIRCWDLRKKREVQRCKDTLPIVSLAFAPDGRILAAVPDSGRVPRSLDKAIRLWRVKDGRQVGKLAEHEGWVKATAFSHDGQILASGDENGVICLWEVAKRQLIRRLVGQRTAILSLAFSPDGHLLASSAATVCLWDCTSGQELACLEPYQKFVSQIAFLAEGSTLLTIGNCLRFWSVGALIRTVAR